MQKPELETPELRKHQVLPSLIVPENVQIKSTQLLCKNSSFLKPYIWPFFTIYPFFCNIYFNTEKYNRYIGGSEWTFVYITALLTIHGIIFLAPFWSINLDSVFNYTKLNNKIDHLGIATHIMIFPIENHGSGEIVPLNYNNVYLNGNEISQISFLFQKRRFIFDSSSNLFVPPLFKIDDPDTLISDFKNSSGLLKNDLSTLLLNYGQNKFDIPVPTFGELFIEHATAPFFVFQIFCIGLWCMDEFWYFSFFNLFMVVTFECTTVWQRRSTLLEFRSMSIKPFKLYCFRSLEWVEIDSYDLLPNDLVSITRSTNDEISIPCDLVLINGSAIVNEAMLSGESTPLLKESIELRPSNDKFDPEGYDKNSILHGGTKVLQITQSQNKNPESHIPNPPDKGALAVVAKTGFETSQGSLVRVMIFSAERISVGNWESFFFILFLLVFAVIASWYVWVEGTKMGRIQSKLILDCILIITSVVPPELPMELTMAVNTSLAALAKYYIYCTEPFRIPLAGRIDVCCFDKTGTLTGENLVFEGLAGFNPSDTRHLFQCKEASNITNYILGSAHALVKLDDGDIVGDPMEIATLKASGWSLSNTKNVIEKDLKYLLKNKIITQVTFEKLIKNEIDKTPYLDQIKILRRFQFSSALKRSSTISKIQKGKILVSVKGAPETIRSRLINVPENYEEIYKSFTRSGSRVLALAYKLLEDNISINKLNNIKRDDIENKLIFGGFIVFHCPLKDDAIDTINMLNNSSHRCVMITGDNPLTAVHVAKQVNIVDRETLILDLPEDHHINEEDENDVELVWRNVKETIVKPYHSKNEIDESIFKNYDICITGYALDKLINHPQILKLIRYTWVYARVSPNQKEFILNSLKELGYNTLMCGDGTNDVGALKQAHVGIALLNATTHGMKKIAENKKIETMKRVYAKQCDLMKRWNQPEPPVPPLIAHLFPPGPTNPHYLKAMEKQGIVITKEMRRLVAEASKKVVGPVPTISNNPQQKAGEIVETLMGSLQDENEDEAPTLKLGDASVAAPFTSKLGSVSAVTNIIRQGRVALVSTIQMYKILALNCLVSAYSLSVIYLAGVKFGDGQATISGLMISSCFLSISKGKPLEQLSKKRPQEGIFNIYIMGSILGQFAIHIVSLIYITTEIYKLEPREPQVNLEKEFAPSLLNTGIFIIQLWLQVVTFAVNYIGEPFRQNIRDNRGMYWGILGCGFLAFAGATEFLPEMNEAIKFVPMGQEFKTKLVLTMVFDFGGSWIIENVLKYFFMDDKSSDIAIRREEQGSGEIEIEIDAKAEKLIEGN
ncbi:ion-transporting P-type ATPase SPF1 [Ascoidea rubescens DSM 1968]|uniref:P-type ATPase n=1 Tax=Ascoidea rubescens DSM 1968 TaxID=1344418 RepID=A0A1D2VGW9_9ASCO|nr:P-type ATPase [Ascoidea rubescens DSM 1968]ODV60842.1 P-type ATPase [Ascoidea rubescens DSM 1968]